MNAMAYPPVAVQDFVSAMGIAATGLSVVPTDGAAGRMRPMASALSSVSAEPPLVLSCFDRKSPAGFAFIANGTIAASLLATHQGGAEPLAYCNRVFPHITNKEGI